MEPGEAGGEAKALFEVFVPRSVSARPLLLSRGELLLRRDVNRILFGTDPAPLLLRPNPAPLALLN